MSNIAKDIRRITVYNILLEFIITKKQLKSIINKHIKKLPINDKKSIFQTCNGSIENYILITSLIRKFSNVRNSNKTISVLLFSIYNLLYSKNMPHYAIINSHLQFGDLKN